MHVSRLMTGTGGVAVGCLILFFGNLHGLQHGSSIGITLAIVALGLVFVVAGIEPIRRWRNRRSEARNRSYSA